MDVIRHQIRALRYKNTDGKWFIPDVSLVSGLSREIIHHLLQNHCEVEPYGVQWMTQAVENGARKVFAILISIREEKKITAFLEHYLQSDGQTLDSRLPFSELELGKIFLPAVANEFEEQQWDFIAPVFNHRLLHRNIPTEFRLPFIESRKLGEGGFGNVYEVVIPAGHHNFKDIDNTKNARIVRKELRKVLGGDDLWVEAGFNEHQIMSYLHHLEHPNILPLLTSYTYNDVPNFLLPLVEGGDLEQFLNAKHRPKDFAEDIRFYDALSGLASALETLHDYKSDVLDKEMIGYHHDLKPKNVLVSEGRFVLSDFGLSKLKTGEDSRTPFKKGQGHYLAPECEDLEHDFSKGVISRASDVWSLGCVMLEVIVFMIGGTDAVAEFREHRKIKQGFLTTKTFFCGKSVNPEVKRKISEVADSENVAVRKVVALIRQILVVDFKKRPKASEITVRLRLISFEASSLRLRAAFQSIRWRIDDLEVISEWNRFHQMTHNLTLRDDTMAIPSLNAKKLEPFADRAHVEKMSASMERLLNTMLSSDLSSDVAPGILLSLRQVIDLLSLQLNNSQRDRSLDNEATHLGTDTGHSAPRSIDVRNLRWDDYALKTVTPANCQLHISKDDKFLAIEYDWQITIYALPSGNKIQKIKLPGELLPGFALGGFPNFRFTPDEKNLIVCWIDHVYCYRVGRDETEPWMVFTPVAPEAWGGRASSIMMPVPIRLASISPDSTKVAIEFYLSIGYNVWEHLVYVVELRHNEGASAERIQTPVGRYAYGERIQATVGEYDCSFGFSPDSRQLAVSNQKTVRYNKQDAIRIRVLDIIPMVIDQQKFRWVTIYCNKTFNKYSHRQTLSRHFPCPIYHVVVFRVWDNRWVAGVWMKSKRTLILHGLYSQSHLVSLELSCLDAFGHGMKGTIFSNDLTLAASCTSPANTILRKLKRGKNKMSDSLVIFANVKTNQVICTLEGVYNRYCLSRSGQYAVILKKKELRLFQISEN